MDAVDALAKNNVTVAGKPDAARTLLFVHGFGTDQQAWDGIATAFAGDFRIVRYDLTGLGKSDPAAFAQHRYLNLRAHAQDLLDILEKLQFDKVTAIGHSMGGMIAALASLKAPSRVSRLVLIGSSPRFLDDDGYRGGFSKEAIAEVYSAITENYEGWVSCFAPLMVGEPQTHSVSRRLASSLRTVPQKFALTIACSIFQCDHRADIEHIAVPTLIVQTRQDNAVPLDVAEFMHARIAGSELKVIDATGHLPHLTAPDAVTAAIAEFIRRP